MGNKTHQSLQFPLDFEDHWPPVSIECLSFEPCAGGLRAMVAPLFVKGLSVGDVIAATLRDGDIVDSWRHVSRSKNTTVWMLRMKRARQDELDRVLAKLRALGCNTVCSDKLGCYSVDVPESVAIGRVDAVLAALDESSVGVAFPSMRHPE